MSTQPEPTPPDAHDRQSPHAEPPAPTDHPQWTAAFDPAAPPPPPAAAQQQGSGGSGPWGHPPPPDASPNGHNGHHRLPGAGPQNQAVTQDPPPQTAGGKAPDRGWWRRNLVGLVTIVPMLAALLATNWNSLYWPIWKGQPRIPVTAPPQRWVPFAGAQLRLVDFGPAGTLYSSADRPITLPDGVTAWKALVEFKAPDQDSVGACEIRLEDRQGRLYGTGAQEVAQVRGQSFVTCTKPSGQESTDYQTTIIFVTPDAVEPVAVQIRWKVFFPRFVRLDLPR